MKAGVKANKARRKAPKRAGDTATYWHYFLVPRKNTATGKSMPTPIRTALTAVGKTKVRRVSTNALDNSSNPLGLLAKVPPIEAVNTRKANPPRASTKP
jgi:hypothetical protein